MIKKIKIILKGKKKYLFELIKNNKWISNLDFWDKFISLMIENEIQKNKEISNKKGQEENEETIKNRLCNICFSQLLEYTSIMIDFGMKRNDVDKIIETFSIKYGISKELKESINESIDMKPQMIEASINKENKEKEKNKEGIEDIKMEIIIDNKKNEVKIKDKKDEVKDKDINDKEELKDQKDKMKNKDIKEEKEDEDKKIKIKEKDDEIKNEIEDKYIKNEDNQKDEKVPNTNGKNEDKKDEN